MDNSTSTLVPPKSTPIKHGTSTLFRFTTNHKYRLKEMSDMGKEMSDYIVGPMPATDFMDEFFPKTSLQTSRQAKIFKRGCFADVVSCTSEVEAYEPFVKAATPFATSLEFVNSSAQIDRSKQSDFSFDIKPDICAYAKDSQRRGLTDIAHAELMIEFKWNASDDPFCDPYIPAGDNEQSILREGKACADTLGQITSYAAAQLGSQFRTCVYSILIVKDSARIIRWDRTGAIVTEAIPYNTDPAIAEFFRRYHKAPSKVRGVDDTISQPTVDEIRLARESLALGDDALFVKMTVPVCNSERSYIAPVPRAQPYTPPGRATRGFIAWDLHRNQKVFVKDTWRVDLPGIEREGETYRLMEEAQVKNIAPCSASGDVENQRTLTHLYENKLWACKAKKPLVPHRHYRLVLDIIGESLTEFSSSSEMLRCVVDALEAHKEAYIKAGVLHRDISIGNIIIVGGRGILIDWDLSKRMTEDSSECDKVRQPTRTGTWQFMSAALVKCNDAPHTFVDDLESIFYVVLWLVLMYSPNSMTAEVRTSFMQQVLDPVQYAGTGGCAKADFLQGRSALRDLELHNPNRPELQTLLLNLATLFSVRYEPEPDQAAWDSLQGLDDKRLNQMPAWQYQKRREHLKSHQHVIQLISGVVRDASGWPSDDRAVEQALLPAQNERSKRKVTKTVWGVESGDRPVKKLRLTSDSSTRG